MGILGRFEFVMSAETRMQKRLPGRTGHETSTLGLGGGYFTERVTKKDAVSVVHKILDSSVNYMSFGRNYRDSATVGSISSAHERPTCALSEGED